MTHFKLAFILIVATQLSAIEPNWNYNYKKALDKAAKSKKLLFIYFSAHWCRYCKIMSSTTFKDKEVQRALKKFVCVKINYDKEPHQVALFKVAGIPASFVVNAKGEIIARLNGYVDSPAFLAWLKQKLKKTTKSKTISPNISLLKKYMQDSKKRSKALDSIFNIIAEKKGRETNALEKLLFETGQKEQKLLLPYLNDKRLLIRIIVGNILQKILGNAFIYDPWEAESKRKKTIEHWLKIKSK